MQPFNLEAALSGEPIIYRDGSKPKGIYFIKEKHSDMQRVLSVHPTEGVQWHYDNGQYNFMKQESRQDLFMAPKEVVRYANVYRDDNGNMHPDKELCMKQNSGEAIAILQMTFLDNKLTDVKIVHEY